MYNKGVYKIETSSNIPKLNIQNYRSNCWSLHLFSVAAYLTSRTQPSQVRIPYLKAHIPTG